MEDPITFDVWGVARGDHRAELVRALTSAVPATKRTAVLVAVNTSFRARAPMLLAQNLGWQAACEARAGFGTIADEVSVFQSGCTPDERVRLGFCTIHQLHFGGCLGCHVCTGFFQR